MEFIGTLGAELRGFLEEPLTTLQPRWVSTSAVIEIEGAAVLADDVTFRAIALGRLDESDPERTYADLREAMLQWSSRDVIVSLGVNTVFWGVTESRHLVDIVNQTDYLADLSGDEKLGQLMAEASVYTGDVGVLDLFVMTASRAQRYPGPEGRPGVPLAVAYESTVYEAGWDRWNLDVAARWSVSLGRLDGAVSYFRGNARTPQLFPDGTPTAPTLRPSYDLIDQVGLEAQWTQGSWLWKAEAMARSGQGPSFAATTFGFEHTRFAVFGSNADLGTILEYSYDGRDDLTYNIYDSDVFAGFRLALNDTGGTELLTGVLQDLDGDATIASFEASQRIGDRWRVELLGRYFDARSEEDPTWWFRRDDHVQALLRYYF